MTLVDANRDILRQLIEVIEQLSADDYGRSLAVLSGNSIGKHVRHIVEFYALLIRSTSSGELNYDQRPRDLQLEVDLHEVIRRVTDFDWAIQQIDVNQSVQLQAVLSTADRSAVHVPSSFGRELLFNLDHAIHHMALIRIAIQTNFEFVTLPPHFGVASATVQHQSKNDPYRPNVIAF